MRATGIDKNTVSAIVNDKAQPRPATLSAIEAALQLTPGTLAGRGEDADPAAPAAELRNVSHLELVNELSYRLEARVREVDELRSKLAPLEEAERERQQRRMDYLGGIDEDSSGHEQWIERQWTLLMFEGSADGSGWGSEERNLYRHLCDLIDTLAFAHENGMEVITGPAYPDEQHDFTTRPNMEARRGLIELTDHEWASRPGLPLGDEDHEPTTTSAPSTFRLAARHAKSRGKVMQNESDKLGEET